MKEFKYKDISGLEEINTPKQLDVFESFGNKGGLKNRYVFDFSSATGQFGLDAQNYFGRRTFNNLQPFAGAYNISKGMPGIAELMVKNKRVYDIVPTPAPASNQHITQTIFDVTGTRYVPYWNENCMIYTDKFIDNNVDADGLENYVKHFRSGYVELTFKTDKANCVLGMGSVQWTSYQKNILQGPAPDTAADQTRISESVVIDGNTSYISEGFITTTLRLDLVQGKLKLSYSSLYGSTQQSFEIISNANLADNQWHHLVINFNKPGTVIEYGKKTNKKSIEFWVDGQLDKASYDYVNDSQIVFPIIEWLMMDPLLAYANTNYESTGWETADGPYSNSFFPYSYIGLSEFRDILGRNFNSVATTSAFRGAINHFVAGINVPLNKYEIQQRNRLFRGYERNAAKVFNVSATMINPTITTNKKKALKLFWNNLINDRAKNGVDLDNNYQVESYSITHKTLNSCTEIHNVDVAKEKTINSLADVRVVFKEHVNIFGPAKDLYVNRAEIWNAGIADSYQMDPRSFSPTLDGLSSLGLDYTASYKQKITPYAAINFTYSGVNLVTGDRVLLTNQLTAKDNGIYIYKGENDILVRAEDANSPSKILNAIVRVTDGHYKDTTWALSNPVSSMSDVQKWIELEYHPDSQTFNTQPIFTTRWSNSNGTERFIDLQQDININKYDLIVFMNYPETAEEIQEHFINAQPYECKTMYDNFIKSLQNVVAQGASLHVSSPKLAEDLGIVKKFTYIDQSVESSDARSAVSDPFAFAEPATRYFDTHRINQYHVSTTITGLTNKETYLLTDFINYVPENTYEYQEYHAKYSYRQFGLQQDNEFIIPGLTLINSTENDKLPGFNQNQRKTKPLAVIAPSDILVGTVVTQLANNYYVGSTATANPYDDYASTIVVHNGQLLNDQPINGKIFINCVEDSYTFSREEYNKAVIQIVPQNDPNETSSRLSWQYSTKRLNRTPQRINVRGLTTFGQTKPTNGGGGPLIQAPSSSSNGIIRSITDTNNVDYQSDLYANTSEEIYPTQIIPVLSMTWLGLSWLAE